METSTKKELSDSLKNALKDEHLWTHQAAKLLNLNPQYISMMLNPNSFEKCGITAWSRLEDWVKSKDSLSNYKFPADEQIWKPKEKAEEKDFNIQSPKNTKGVPKMKNPPPPPEKKINGHKQSSAEDKGIQIESKVDLLEHLNSDHFIDLLKEEITRLKEENIELDRKVTVLQGDNNDLKSINNHLANTSPIATLESTGVTQKLAIDIEINLLICGQKIQMKL